MKVTKGRDEESGSLQAVERWTGSAALVVGRLNVVSMRSRG
jgi:hypothetical protein